ncbi:MAG: WG repeat-containing protein [Clostridia bacterium]|nr:WG repeat-containing protein [Clostridia bacterium]
MKKLVIFMLVGILILTGCSSANEIEIRTNDDTKSAVSSTDVSSEETPNWPKAKESDIYKVEVVAENLDIGYVFCDFTEDGYAIVEKDRDNPESLCAYMDTNGKILGKGFVYKDAYPFDEKSGLAYVVLSDETQAYIDKNFEVVLKETDINTKGIKYDEILLESFTEGYAVVHLKSEDKSYYGIINSKGKLTAKFNEYYYSTNYDGTFSKTKYFDDINEGFVKEIVDERGNTITKLAPGEEYLYCGSGFRFYAFENENHDMVMGLLDEKFNKISDKVYYYQPYLYTTSDLVCVERYDTDEIVFINSKGEEKLKIDGITSASVSGKVISVLKDKYDYIYDMNGKQTSFRGYDSVYGDINNEYCIVTDNDYDMIVDVYGNIIYQGDSESLGPVVTEESRGSGCFFVNTKDGYDLIKVVKK